MYPNEATALESELSAYIKRLVIAGLLTALASLASAQEGTWHTIVAPPNSTFSKLGYLVEVLLPPVSRGPNGAVYESRVSLNLSPNGNASRLLAPNDTIRAKLTVLCDQRGASLDFEGVALRPRVGNYTIPDASLPGARKVLSQLVNDPWLRKEACDIPDVLAVSPMPQPLPPRSDAYVKREAAEAAKASVCGGFLRNYTLHGHIAVDIDKLPKPGKTASWSKVVKVTKPFYPYGFKATRVGFGFKLPEDDKNTKFLYMGTFVVGEQPEVIAAVKKELKITSKGQFTQPEASFFVDERRTTKNKWSHPLPAALLASAQQRSKKKGASVAVSGAVEVEETDKHREVLITCVYRFRNY
jgi:hypothetical protein